MDATALLAEHRALKAEIEQFEQRPPPQTSNELAEMIADLAQLQQRRVALRARVDELQRSKMIIV